MALLLSEWMGNTVAEWKEVSSRLMRVRVRMGRERWAFVSAYGPGCERSEEERDEFWNDLTRQVLGRPVCDRGAIPRTLVQWNVVRSRLIILINEEINETNWMVSNSEKLDCRTKQHTQFGVSASNGSRDMARTKSWWKKQKKVKKQKITKRIGW